MASKGKSMISIGLRLGIAFPKGGVTSQRNVATRSPAASTVESGSQAQTKATAAAQTN